MPARSSRAVTRAKVLTPWRTRDRACVGSAATTTYPVGITVWWRGISQAARRRLAHDNGRWSVADPRMTSANDKLIAIVRALDGLSDQAWRERIGNAVPPDAARAIAEVVGTTLLLAESGETCMLSATPVWLRPVAVALSVAQPAEIM